MISLEGAGFRYENGGDSVSGMDLEVKRGEFVVLIGPSGSGKTTVIRMINGLAGGFYKGELTGCVKLNGTDVSGSRSWERGRMVGTVFQDPRSQFFSFLVEGEIAFGCENHGHSSEEIRERVDRAMEEMDICDLRGRDLRGLSNGEKQKVAIASVRAVGPDIYVFDEPSSNLDPDATLQLRSVMERLKDEGRTILVSEHRLWYLMDLADRFVYMKDGRVEGTYDAEGLRALTDQELEAKGLRQTSPSQADLPGSGGNGTGLAARSLSFGYGRTQVLCGISLNADRGRIIAITGPNGAGKTTLARILCGQLREGDGSISVDGRDLSKRKRRRRIRFIPNDTGTQLFGESLKEELLLMTKRTEDDVRNAESLLERFGLMHLKDRHPATLSGGQKQRLVVAVAMMEDADILILDEPTSGLDRRNMEMISRALKDAAAAGKAVAVITHDQEFIRSACDYIFRM